MQYIINQEIFYTLSYNEENTMKIAICDDNEAELNRIRELLYMPLTKVRSFL